MQTTPVMLAWIAALATVHAQDPDERPTAPSTETPSAAFPAATPKSQGLDPDAVGALDAAVEGFVRRGWIIGGELLVIRNRKTVLHTAHGWQDRETETPMTIDTVFNLRSMAKPLVATTALLAASEGALAMDQPVARHLSAFDHDGAEAITLRHLATHRSGLPDRNPAGRPEDYPDLRAVADHWGTVGPSEFAPGESFLYSDPGYDVLGAAMASACGDSLEHLVTAKLLHPLAMNDSFAMTDAAAAEGRKIASAYAARALRWTRYWQPGDAPLAPFVRGSGTTWYGTPRDYAELLQLWMDGGVHRGERLLPREAVAAALTPVSHFDYVTRIPGLEVRYATGWIVWVRPADDGWEEVVGFGHSGSDGTYAWAFPEQDLMVLYFTQTRGQKTRLLLEARFAELLGS